MITLLNHWMETTTKNSNEIVACYKSYQFFAGSIYDTRLWLTMLDVSFDSSSTPLNEWVTLDKTTCIWFLLFHLWSVYLPRRDLLGGVPDQWGRSGGQRYSGGPRCLSCSFLARALEDHVSTVLLSPTEDLRPKEGPGTPRTTAAAGEQQTEIRREETR